MLGFLMQQFRVRYPFMPPFKSKVDHFIERKTILDAAIYDSQFMANSSLN